jgi:bacillithiol synthase
MQYLSHKETNAFSTIVLDYLAQQAKLLPFIQNWPSINNIKKQIELKQSSLKNRNVLKQVLLAQYNNIDKQPITINNINALANENTFTICTAHQPCLFMGPMYLIYKIAHTIALSNYLNKEMPNYNFVPIYYMGTEDADIEEVGTTNIYDKKFAWHPAEQGPVGRLPTASMHNLLLDLNKYLNDNNENDAYIIKLFNEAYTKHTTLAKATQYIVNSLFAAHGLLIIDPDDAQLKQLYKPIIIDELNNSSSYQAVAQTNSLLQEHYKTQAFARPINLFFAKGNSRERIERVGDTYLVNNTDLQFTKSEILDLVDSNPEWFSGNVILRGVYQENILPNIAFVGGGGELAYWLQTKQVFQHFSIPFPILVLRQSAVYIQNTILEKYNTITNDISLAFKDENYIAKYYLEKNESLVDFSVMDNAHNLLFEHYASLLQALHKEIGKSLEAHITKSKKVQHAFQKKIVRVLKQKNSTEINKILALRNVIFPQGAFQERTDSFIPYYSILGQTLINDFVANCAPFGDKVMLVNY